MITFRDSPLAASRCKRAAELARLRTNHPEGGPFRSDRAIHRSIYLYVNMWRSPRGAPPTNILRLSYTKNGFLVCSNQSKNCGCSFLSLKNCESYNRTPPSPTHKRKVVQKEKWWFWRFLAIFATMKQFREALDSCTSGEYPWGDSLAFVWPSMSYCGLQTSSQRLDCRLAPF